MTRTEIVTGSALALLAGLAIGQLYLDRGAPQDDAQSKPQAEAKVESREPPAETRPVGIDEVAQSFVESLGQGGELDRSVAFESLLDELESPTYAKARLSYDAAKPLVEAAVETIDATGSDAPESAALKQRLARFIAGRTRTEASRDFVLKTLEAGPADLRLAVVESVGAPQGVIGKAVFDDLAKLAQNGQIPIEKAVPAMRRASSKRAQAGIVALMKSTDSVKVIDACVVALQDYQDPALLGQGLERLEQTGMIDHPSQLPWLSGKLLQKHLETADGAALIRALKAIRTRPALAKDELAALERGLSKTETRELAVTAVRNAVMTKTLSPEDGEKLLAGKSDEKKPDVLKAELPPARPAVKAQ